MPRHISYGGSGYEPNLKVKVVAGIFDKKQAKTHTDPERRPRQPDEVFVTEKESDAMNWDKQVDRLEEEAKEYVKEKEKIIAELWEEEPTEEDTNVRWEEERKVTELGDSDIEEDDETAGKIKVNVSDLRELATGYQKMEDRTEKYKEKEKKYKDEIEELENLNKKQSGRLELIEAETESNIKEIKWFKKKLMKAEKDLEEMTSKYETQMIIQGEITKFFNKINPDVKTKNKKD